MEKMENRWVSGTRYTKIGPAKFGQAALQHFQTLNVKRPGIFDLSQAGFVRQGETREATVQEASGWRSATECG